MAADIVPESKTLHIRKLRFRWQVLLLQTLSTISLLFLMRQMSELYGECSEKFVACLLYTSPSPRDATLSRMPSSA